MLRGFLTFLTALYLSLFWLKRLFFAPFHLKPPYLPLYKAKQVNPSSDDLSAFKSPSSYPVISQRKSESRVPLIIVHFHSRGLTS